MNLTPVNDFPALCGRTVTEGHAMICGERGHAVRTVDGVATGICPRCGEVEPAEPAEEGPKPMTELPTPRPADPVLDRLHNAAHALVLALDILAAIRHAERISRGVFKVTRTDEVRVHEALARLDAAVTEYREGQQP